MKAVKCACGVKEEPFILSYTARCQFCATSVTSYIAVKPSVIIKMWNAAQQVLKAEQKRIKKGAKHGSK